MRLKWSRLTDTYVLKGFHVHFGCENERGSEHTRNGRRYSGEVIRCDTLFLSKGEFLLICCFTSSLKSHKKLTFWFVQGTRGLSFSPSAQFRSLLKFQYSLAELLFSFQVHFLFEDPSGRYVVVAFWPRANTDHHMIYIYIYRVHESRNCQINGRERNGCRPGKLLKLQKALESKNHFWLSLRQP